MAQETSTFPDRASVVRISLPSQSILDTLYPPLLELAPLDNLALHRSAIRLVVRQVL